MKHKYQLMTADQERILVECFEKHHEGIGPDYLAYTPQWDRLAAEFRSKSKTCLSLHIIWCNMIRLRKRGQIILKNGD